MQEVVLLNVVRKFFLFRCLQDSDIEASAEADVALLKLRNITLRIVGAASRLGHSKVTNDQASANKENRYL